MALTETTKIDKIEVIENNSIQIRTANIIERDGIEISRIFHRHVIHPGEDISKEDQKIKEIANALWTNDVINAYKELISKNTLGS